MLGRTLGWRLTLGNECSGTLRTLDTANKRFSHFTPRFCRKMSGLR